MPSLPSRAIVADLVRGFNRAETEWSVRSENFQWDLPDGSRRFFVPDLVVARPGAASNEEVRAGPVPDQDIRQAISGSG